MFLKHMLKCKFLFFNTIQGTFQTKNFFVYIKWGKIYFYNLYNVFIRKIVGVNKNIINEGCF